MEILNRVARRMKIDGDIYESYGELKIKYFFGATDGEELSLLMPFFPSGIICDFFVMCDGEKFASAKAVNIREISDFPKNRYISLQRLSTGLFVINLKGVKADFGLEIWLTVCTELSRHGQNLTLTLTAPQSISQSCPISANLNFHGRVKKAVCHGAKHTETVFKGFCRISVCDAVVPIFILDVFYADNPVNRIIISRQPLRKNIGLCSFTPQLSSISKKHRKFDINISFRHGDRSEIISALATILACLRKDDDFRITAGQTRLTEFSSATSNNIDIALEIACNTQNNDGFLIETGDFNTIIIGNGANFDTDTPLSGTPFLIFSGEFPVGVPLENSTFIGKGEGEYVIPMRFASLYEKRLSPAIIEPVGGIGVDLLWDKFRGLSANTVCNCFALHDIIPPVGFKIFNNRRRFIEEIVFERTITDSTIRVIDILYGVTVIKKKEAERAEALPEERCVYRQEINEICLRNKIAMGDIALVCVAGNEEIGRISPLPALSEIDDTYFREDDNINACDIIDLILKNQTIDGIIADITVSRHDQQVFSTALCLIALYIYENKKYVDFAKRSLNFLKNQNGYWAKTALDLWNGKEIDQNLLDEKLEMKIMGKNLHELALIIIKNHRRNFK